MIAKIIEWVRSIGHKQPAQPVLSTPIEVYKALREDMMNAPTLRPIYLCRLLDSLVCIRGIAPGVEEVVRQRFKDAVSASGGAKAIWLPREVSNWLIETDNLFTDTDEGCRESIRLGVLDQLIAEEEAK